MPETPELVTRPQRGGAQIVHRYASNDRFRSVPRKLVDGYDEVNGVWAEGSPIGRFMTAVRAGNYMGTACRYAGITDRSIQRWVAKAREVVGDDDYMPDRLTFDDPSDRLYATFLGKLVQTEAMAEVELVALWRSAAREDWKAAARFLATRHPERWADGQQVAVGGDDVDISAMEVAALLSDVNVLEAAESLAEAAELSRNRSSGVVDVESTE